jgi:hypothetical protein
MNVTLPGEKNGNVIKINQSFLEQYLPYSFRTRYLQRALLSFSENLRKLNCYKFIWPWTISQLSVNNVRAGASSHRQILIKLPLAVSLWWWNCSQITGSNGRRELWSTHIGTIFHTNTATSCFKLSRKQRPIRIFNSHKIQGNLPMFASWLVTYSSISPYLQLRVMEMLGIPQAPIFLLHS